MIKEKEILLTSTGSHAFLYEFPKYTFWKQSQLKAEKIKKCKFSFWLDFLFGSPKADFTAIKGEHLLIIDDDGRKWHVEHGYLNVSYPDRFRFSRVKTVISVTSDDGDSCYFVGISLVSHLGYAKTIEKFKYEELLWRP